MFCPHCGQEQHCPCESCQPRHKEKVVWINDESGLFITCGKCGLTARSDWWETLSYEVFKLLGIKK